MALKSQLLGKSISLTNLGKSSWSAELNEEAKKNNFTIILNFGFK